MWVRTSGLLLIILVLLINSCTSTPDQQKVIDKDEQLKPEVVNQMETIQVIEEATTDQTATEQSLVIMGRCEYRKINGQAEILVVQRINQLQIEVTINFLPDNPGEVEKYRFPNIKDQEHNIVIDFKQEEEEDLSAGFIIDSLMPCFRYEKMSGTCSPVVFKIVGFD